MENIVFFHQLSTWLGPLYSFEQSTQSSSTENPHTPNPNHCVYHMHTKVHFCIYIERQIETETCGVDTHFHNLQ